MGHVPGGSLTAPVPARSEKGQAAKDDPDSTETDREFE